MIVAKSFKKRGFTLIEVLVVIAIIGIMSSLVVTVYRNVAQDSRDVVAKQQQAAVQNALNSWITAQSTTKSISQIRTAYNGLSDSPARLAQIKDYLDDRTYAHFLGYSPAGTDAVKSAALIKTEQFLQLADWQISTTGATTYPQVHMKASGS